MKIILIGIQGSGKSTQGNLLSEKLGIPYLSTGHIFREMAKEETAWGRYVKETLAAGYLIPDDKTIALIEEYLKKVEYEKGYILDGFPRTFAQAQAFKDKLDVVIYLQVSDREALRRLSLRSNGKDAREDDTVAGIRKRIELFHRFTESVLDFYRKKGLLVEIDGQRPIEQIHKDICVRLGVT